MKDKNNGKSGEKLSSGNGRYLRIVLGVFLISLGIIGASGYTILGEVITYSLAYAFGLFYPFVLAFIIGIGFWLALKKKIDFHKEGFALALGVILLCVSSLALGSYSFLSDEPAMRFSDMSDIYQDRFIAFSRYPFMVDDYSSLGHLGGGFVGLFFLSLLYGSWGAVIDCVFYSCILLLSLFLVFFMPVRSLILNLKDRKKEEVKSVSGNVLETPSRENLTPTVRNDEVFSDIDLHADMKKKQEDDFLPGGFVFSKKLQEEKEKKESPAAVVPEKKTEPKKESPAEPSLSESHKAPQALFKTRTYEPEEKEEPVITPVASSQDRIARKSEMAENRKNALSRKEPPKEEAIEEEKPVLNPLLEQAKKVSQESEAEMNAEIQVEDASPVEEKAEEVPLEEETSSEEALESLFFQMKDQKEKEKKAEKDAAKKKKMDSLMKYVDKTPKRYGYSLPDDSLLLESDSGDKKEKNIQVAREKAKVINQVFKDFHFPAQATTFTIGASVTRFNIVTEPGVKADKMESLLSELQRALKGDQSVRIQTVVEGMSTSGIELGNEVQMPVSFKSVFKEIEKDAEKNLLLPIGKDISGRIITYPLNEMPHLLVAGTTGSGKSVLINCMIMTLIMRNYPSQLKLMLIDPKQVEFAKYNMEPHLLCPVIQDSDSAVIALKKLVDEMNRRYKILSDNNVVKISDYRKLQQMHPSTMEELPDIAVFIDEFADLMNSGGALIAEYVKTLTQKSRASGIYLVIATQRPSKDAIPMSIKANITVRVGLSCSSQVDSRVILDENGCETLVGKGDLLFKCPGRRSLLRCQSPFVSDSEMDQVLEYVRENAGDPSYNPEFLDLEKKSEEEDAATQMTLDDIFDDVKDFVMYTGICSRSSIMRNFSLSYAKADQMLMRLRNLGIIKPMQGGKNVVVVRKKMEN